MMLEHRIRRRKKSAQGFTLIEIIVAASVLTIGSVIAYPTLFSIMGLSKTSHELNIAVYDMEEVIEDIRSTVFDEILLRFPDGQDVAQFTDLHLRDERIRVNYFMASADPLMITVECTWTDFQGRSQSKKLWTSRTR